MTYKRKTKDEFIIQGDHGYGHGFEDECTEDTRKGAKDRLKEYRENGNGSYRIVKRRVKIKANENKGV